MNAALAHTRLTRQQIDELRRLAESAARAGGDVARQAFGQRQVVSLKDDRSEVTEIDLAAERAIVAHIRAARPDDLFVTEEGTTGPAPDRADRGQVCWIIDPIDGTRNYIRGAGCFTCSVAAMCGQHLLAGAVYDPLRDVMYSAGAGGNLLVGGRPVRLDDVVDAQAARHRRLIVAIPSSRRESTRELVRLVVDRHVVRNYGSTALHLAMVAAGQLDAAVSGTGKLWDIAAGVLLVEQAGGCISQPDGRTPLALDADHYSGRELPFLVGNPTAHQRLAAELRAREAT